MVVGILAGAAAFFLREHEVTNPFLFCASSSSIISIQGRLSATMPVNMGDELTLLFNVLHFDGLGDMLYGSTLDSGVNKIIEILMNF